MASSYADDNVFMTKSEDITILEQLRNTDVHLIWMCCVNRMVVSMQKSHFMMLFHVATAD